MPKSYKNKKGGFWGEYLKKAKGLNPFAKKEEIPTTNDYVPPSAPPAAPDMTAAPDMNAPAVTTPAVTTSAVEPPAVTTSADSVVPTGGRRRKSRRRRSRKHKKQRGGVHPNETSSRLALNAMPFSGKTAEPQVWLGGKTRKRRKNKRRSKSHKKHKH